MKPTCQSFRISSKARIMLKLSLPNISESAIDAVAQVLRSGQLVHGSECDAFEQDLAAYLGCLDVVLVSSGTAALHVALLALDIGPGDAVIVPDFTFPATANVVAITGARPLIVDVLSSDYTIDTAQLERLVQTWEGPERLRAIIPVHEFGCMANMEAILNISKAYGLAVIEDAACALGAKLKGQKAGTFGDAGCFSFHPRKTLTTGEGGAIACKNTELAARMRRLRNHGIERNLIGVHFREPATNYRLTNFQAALGRQQLPQLDDWIQVRRQLAKEYLQELTPLSQSGYLFLPKWQEEHSWQTFMILLNVSANRRTEVIEQLKLKGIESNLGAQSLSTIGIYGQPLQDCPIGGTLYRQGLALPLYERMTTDDVKRVAASLASILSP